MTYEEAVAAFEGKFQHVVVDGIHTNHARDERGKEYQAIYANHKNGSNGRPSTPITSETPSKAFEKWLECALDSIPDRSITLYWRVMPHCIVEGQNSGCFAFARASFSALPPLPKEEPSEPSE